MSQLLYCLITQEGPLVNESSDHDSDLTEQSHEQVRQQPSLRQYVEERETESVLRLRLLSKRFIVRVCTTCVIRSIVENVQNTEDLVSLDIVKASSTHVCDF